MATKPTAWASHLEPGHRLGLSLKVVCSDDVLDVEPKLPSHKSKVAVRLLDGLPLNVNDDVLPKLVAGACATRSV